MECVNFEYCKWYCKDCEFWDVPVCDSCLDENHERNMFLNDWRYNKIDFITNNNELVHTNLEQTFMNKFKIKCIKKICSLFKINDKEVIFRYFNIER